jgi:hypothetical protein
MSNIPKQIHIAWNDPNVLESKSPLIVNGLKQLATLNPEWNITISTDQDIDSYLKSILDPNDYKLVENTHIVEKSDLWRLFKIYFEGGMYVDIDRFCNVKLSEVIPDNILCVLPTCLDNDFSQDIMISAPGNKIYEQTINLILQRRAEGHTNTYFLGPQTFMHGVTLTLFNQMINTNPGKEVLEDMRKVISETKTIISYREYPPYNTFIYKHNKDSFFTDDGVIDHESLKRRFYKESNIKHWTNEW